VRRDRLVRTTMLLRLAFLALAALAVAHDRVGLGVAAVALAVTASTPTYPAIAASLPRLAGPGRGRATELLVTIEVGSWVVGPALGGLLLTQSLRPWTLVVSVALAGLGLILSTGISLPGPVEKAPDAVAGMLRAVVGCPPAVSALALAGLLNFVITVTGIALLPLSIDAWGTGEAGFGMATACLGFGALAAPALARLVTATSTRGLLALAAAVVLVSASPVQWPALPVLVLAGATGVVVESQVTGTLQCAVPDRYRAGALGLADTIMVGACLVGSLAAPVLTRAAGARPALLLVALVAVLPVLAGRLLPTSRPVTAYDAPGERAAGGPHPRSAPPVGAARVA
jgi:hypothetical protein